VPSNKPFSWSGLLPFLDLPPGSVTITAEPRVVKTGDDTMLSGQATSARAQEIVSVYARRPDAVAWTKLGNAAVTGDGTWTFRVRGLRRTAVYRAVSLGALSRTVSVRVRGRG
jgi:hypothetical protein